MSLNQIRADWLGNVRGDLLAGMVVAIALIPEAIAFSIIAGVDPRVGLYASFCIAMTIAIVGGRPAMISAATGSVALVMGTLVREHGLQYLLAASLLAGVIQVAAGALRLGVLMRFVSRSVMTGFVNALAILIFLAQLPQLVGMGPLTYGFVAAGLAIIYLFPYLTKSIPSPLVCIVALTAAAIYWHLPLRTVADMGRLPTELPMLAWPDVPLSFETLRIIAPYSVAMGLVGLLESLMTANVIDDMTDTGSDKNRECIGLGISNFVSGLFGGMAGCAMIGQSVINVSSGGRGRLSTFFAGLFLLVLLVILGRWVGQVPMAALVAVMIMVSISTFSWSSLRNLRTHPKTSSTVMLATVAVVVATGDLSQGVLVGVLLSGVFFAFKVAQLVHVRSELSADGTTRTYLVSGQIFFASADVFAGAIDTHETVARVRIDLTHAHFWDISGIGALDRVVTKLRARGATVEVDGLNEASATMVDRLAEYDKPGGARLAAH